MAALDFGMALARGMLPQSEKAQKDLINLAGGRNVFKSEDWWNKEVDKQISEGYRESEKGTEYMTKSGQYVLGKRTMSGGGGHPLYGIPSSPRLSYEAPKDALITGYTRGASTYERLMMGMGGPNPIYQTRTVDVYGDFSKRKDYTAGELSDIETSAKAGAARAKKETAASQAAKKKLRRGTGGLLAKAATPEDTGLPALGQGGLGYTSTILGQETKL